MDFSLGEYIPLSAAYRLLFSSIADKLDAIQAMSLDQFPPSGTYGHINALKSLDTSMFDDQELLHVERFCNGVRNAGGSVVRLAALVKSRLGCTLTKWLVMLYRLAKLVSTFREGFGAFNAEVEAKHPTTQSGRRRLSLRKKASREVRMERMRKWDEAMSRTYAENEARDYRRFKKM